MWGREEVETEGGGSEGSGRLRWNLRAREGAELVGTKAAQSDNTHTHTPRVGHVKKVNEQTYKSPSLYRGTCICRQLLQKD